MASTVEKQKFLKGFKTRTQGSWKKKANQEPKARGQVLPGGLKDAVGQVSSYKIGQYEDGTPFVTITMICKEPADIVGMRATVKHKIAETESKTVDKCVDDLVSDLQLMGGATTKKDGTPRSEDEIPQIVEEIVKAKPHVLFNTKAWNFNSQTGVSVFPQGTCAPVGDDIEPEAPTDEAPPDEPTDEAPPEDEAPTDEAPADESDDAWEPAIGEEYKHKGKSCEITGVQKAKQTVTIKKGKAILKSVPWADLESAE